MIRHALITATAGLLALAPPGAAQHTTSPYAGYESRPIKALSDDDLS